MGSTSSIIATNVTVNGNASFAATNLPLTTICTAYVNLRLAMQKEASK